MRTAWLLIALGAFLLLTVGLDLVWGQGLSLFRLFLAGILIVTGIRMARPGSVG